MPYKDPKKRKEYHKNYMKTYIKTGKHILAQKKSRLKTKLEVFSHYMDDKIKCACPKCDIENIHFLTMDHINGGGNKHRKKLKMGGGYLFYLWLRKNNYPKGYQILCYNCNFAKGANNNKCPHLMDC